MFGEEITKQEVETLIYHSSVAKQITDDILRKAGVENIKLVNLLNNVQYGYNTDIDSIMDDINTILDINDYLRNEDSLTIE